MIPGISKTKLGRRERGSWQELKPNKVRQVARAQQQRRERTCGRQGGRARVGTSCADCSKYRDTAPNSGKIYQCFLESPKQSWGAVNWVVGGNHCHVLFLSKVWHQAVSRECTCVAGVEREHLLHRWLKIWGFFSAFSQNFKTKLGCCGRGSWQELRPSGLPEPRVACGARTAAARAHVRQAGRGRERGRILRRLLKIRLPAARLR